MPDPVPAPESDELLGLRAWLASDPVAWSHARDVRWAVAEIERLRARQATRPTRPRPVDGDNAPAGPSYARLALDAINAEIPGLDPPLASLYGLLALTKGGATTLRDVHDAWALWTVANRPGHRSLVPFEDLAVDVQELDRPYREGIHRAAARLLAPVTSGAAQS